MKEISMTADALEQKAIEEARKVFGDEQIRRKHEQDFIMKFYDGNRAEYEVDQERFKTQLERNKDRPVLWWSTLEANVNCSPDYADHAVNLIFIFLGYLPDPLIYIRYQGALASLCERFYSGQITKAQYIGEGEYLIKQVRNDDLVKYKWVVYREFTDKELREYTTYLPHYADKARDRLCAFLDYEPDVKHSLSAEIFLRDDFNHHRGELKIGDADYRAAEIYHCQKAFAEGGEDAARNVPLVLLGNYLRRNEDFSERLKLN